MNLEETTVLNDLDRLLQRDGEGFEKKVREIIKLRRKARFLALRRERARVHKEDYLPKLYDWCIANLKPDVIVSIDRFHSRADRREQADPYHFTPGFGQHDRSRGPDLRFNALWSDDRKIIDVLPSKLSIDCFRCAWVDNEWFVDTGRIVRYHFKTITRIIDRTKTNDYRWFNISELVHAKTPLS